MSLGFGDFKVLRYTPNKGNMLCLLSYIDEGLRSQPLNRQSSLAAFFRHTFSRGLETRLNPKYDHVIFISLLSCL